MDVNVSELLSGKVVKNFHSIVSKFHPILEKKITTIPPEANWRGESTANEEEQCRVDRRSKCDGI